MGVLGIAITPIKIQNKMLFLCKRPTQIFKEKKYQPVLALSSTPNGLTRLKNASTLVVLPHISTMTLFSLTSTSLAPNWEARTEMEWRWLCLRRRASETDSRWGCWNCWGWWFARVRLGDGEEGGESAECSKLCASAISRSNFDDGSTSCSGSGSLRGSCDGPP